MRILILNDRPWHYECYIHIIDFCIESNIEIDILQSYEDALGSKDFYLNYFKNNIRYVKGVNKLKDKCLADPFTNKKYDKVFVVTDNFIKTQYFNYFESLKPNSSADDQLIFIDHSNKIRNKFSNHIDIRHFPDKNNHYAYYCVDLISQKEKQEILSQEKQTNILVSANPNNINIAKEVQTLNNINPNAHIHWVSRDLSKLKKLKLNNISCHESLDQLSFNELLKKSHYVYVPEYHNKNYRTESTTSILSSAYSYLCQIIWEGRNYNKHYKLYSPLEYSQDLEIDHNPDIDLVAKERLELINHRNKVFSSFLPKSKHKLYATTLNYNQPELTDNIYNELISEQKQCIVNVEILDNGSSKNKANNTTLPLSDNLFFGGGVNILLKKFLESDNEYFAIINNDIIFYGKHFFDNAIQEMIDHDIALYSPSVINSTIKKCSWPQMWNWYTKSIRNVDFIDWMFPIMRRDLAEIIVQFPEELHLGWGLDFYSGIIAKENGLKVGVSDNLTVSHLVSNTFRSGNIDITENKFSIDAGNNMNKYFLNSKYKSDFLWMHQKNLKYKI